MQPLTRTATLDLSAISFLQTRAGRVTLAIAATGLVALCAHVAVPLPFTPVPLTLQTFAVLLIGFLLGPVAGFFSLLGYLAEGAIGMPVFSLHGAGGIAQLMGPTGGYLLAYPLVAAIAGYLARTLRRTWIAYAVAGTTATLLLFVCGAAWMIALLHTGIHATWIAAVAPFLPGEVIKICAAAGIARAIDRHPNT
jgi:biotin transport system substrate-specific component